MKRLKLFMILTAFGLISYSQNEPFTKRNVISGLNSPWEILYGPNDSLWVTENVAYLVKRVNISNGNATTLINLSSLKNFSQGDGGRWPQGGLMGMALHPNLYSNNVAVRSAKPWIYLAYVFSRPLGQTCSTNSGSSNPCNFFTRIVRYEYNGNSLTNPVILLDSIPGSNDHNSGRMTIGPDLKLYYTIGDLGAGQFNNASRPNNAQVLDDLEGKIIRLNTETDFDAGDDEWVPDDNPYYNGSPITARDYVYTLGHRNAQGVVWGNINGIDMLYSSEHGDKTDDEVNRLVAGGNYGWPRMAGYNDGNYDGMTLGGYSPVNEGGFCSSISNEQMPIFTLFTRNSAQINALSGDYLTWPTVAPSSIDLYRFVKIPGWQNSLLLPCLKSGRVYRIKLNTNGDGTIPVSGSADTTSYFRGEGRFRDIAISPDGLKFYLACDATGQTSGPTGSFNGGGTAPPNAGSILEFTYTGIILPMNEVTRQRPVREQYIKIFPVPAKDELVVSIKAAVQKPFTLEIINASGTALRNNKSSKSEVRIEIKDLAAGVYLLQIRNAFGQLQQTEKFIKF